jgi:hypothetical protein
MNCPNFREIKRVIEEHDCTVCSHNFFIKYCKQKELSDSEIKRVEEKLKEVYPHIDGDYCYISGSFLGGVIAILSRDMIFGYVGLDQFKTVTFLPETDYKFYFKAYENLRKAQKYINAAGEAFAPQKSRHYREMKKLLGEEFEFSWASSMDLNFVINYHEPKRSKSGSIVSGICWNTEATDNEIIIKNEL